jgi:hypothetical protein
MVLSDIIPNPIANTVYDKVSPKNCSVIGIGFSIITISTTSIYKVSRVLITVFEQKVVEGF